MSVLPVLLDLADELTSFDRPSRSWWYDDLYGGDYFGLNRSPSLSLALPRHRYCPYLVAKRGAGGKKKKEDTIVGKDGFQACMDVKQFKPSELTVKTVDNQVVVEGKHEEREDEQGYVSRHFVRRYTLPKGYDPKEVVSTLSSDGILTIKAPPPPSKSLKNKERLIQIQQTGPAHLNIKDNSNEKVENGSDDKMES